MNTQFLLLLELWSSKLDGWQRQVGAVVLGTALAGVTDGRFE